MKKATQATPPERMKPRLAWLCPYCGKEKPECDEPSSWACCGEAGHAQETRVCPECSGETVTEHFKAADCNAGCDTSVTACLDCDWQGQPE